MIKYIIILISLVTNLYAGKVVLRENNTFGITEEFTEELQERFTLKVLTMPEKVLKIYIDSPGGSVFALARMVEVMENSDKTFVCIVRFAASAAFALLQSCTHRFILPDGILMQHNASVALSGELPKIRGLLTVLESNVRDLAQKQASRMGLSLSEFESLIANDVWYSSKEAVSNNAADSILDSVTCSKGLISKRITRNVTIRTLFGSRTETKTYSACPLLTQPVDRESDANNSSKNINNTNFDLIWR